MVVETSGMQDPHLYDVEPTLRDRTDDTTQIALESLSAEPPPLLRFTDVSEAIVRGSWGQRRRVAWAGPRL